MKLLLTILTILSLFIGFSQTDKKINKAIKAFEKDYSKGIE